MSALSAEGLYKVFGRRSKEVVRRLQSGATLDEVKPLGATVAVADATFDVEPGEIFVVMGLSGSGKSTLIRMLNGLWEPSAGHVYVDGKDVAKLDPRGLRQLRRETMSMVFQHFALLPHRTVLENAAYALRVRDVDRATRVEKARVALSMVGLEGWENRLPQQLSGGMKQRVGLARALASETPIMLMDEAFSALDPLIRREMQDQLLELQSRLEKTIIFITHDLNEAMRLGDRIAVMRAGQIVQIGTGEEILQDPANDYVAQFVQDVDRTRVLTASSVMEPARTVVIDTEGPRAVLRQMREEQAHAAFVVSRDRILRGTIRDEAAQAAVSRGREGMREVLNTTPATVTADALLADVFAPSAESSLPVAVVDEDNRLLGVIPRATLLGAMASLTATETSGSGGSTAEAYPGSPPDGEADRARADAMFELQRGSASGAPAAGGGV
ncbi:MAG: betaine/proline/choline family ABC transporter ATP-binding protein [Micromonosporaceae bacterium]|nr:betaine/proline/choline family ABC transporter ATP-binding protein [Micromonosporaceae bacterium]